MKRTHRILSILLAAAMLLPSQALAADIAPKSQTQQPSIVINEVESNGDATDWVEIMNVGTQPVDISGWYLLDNDPVGHKADVNFRTARKRRFLVWSGIAAMIISAMHRLITGI